MGVKTLIMGFATAKTILYLLLPPASLLIIMALGFLVIGFLRGLGRSLIAVGFILLYLFSIGPVSDALLKPLETSSPPWKDGQVKADAIVVLGGGVRDLSWLERPSVPSCSSLERVVMGIMLYRGLHLPVVLMGGNGDPSRAVVPDADAMARTAHGLGVPARDVMVENKSRNTLESARALKSMIKGRRIILVTSAFHMKRASAMFAKQGFHVAPAPAGYRHERKKLSFYSFIPHAGNLADSSAALSEYVSLFWYSMNGAI
jgi:uncharacterized SAM-binding protein YcdF (DUF218 family)